MSTSPQATGGVATGGTSTGGVATGGAGGANTSGQATGGAATGGVGTGGVATGGAATGGANTGGQATGGDATGGMGTGGQATGGDATGGMGTGGQATGGDATGGMGTGGQATGGDATGGMGTGGQATGGDATGGMGTGGQATGGDATGGMGTGGAMPRVPNGSFEMDPPGTADSAITDWDLNLYSMTDSGTHGTPALAQHVLDISSDRYFEGLQSLHSYLENVQGNSPGNDPTLRHVTHEIYTEIPLSTTATQVSFWRSDVDYSTSSRYYWQIVIILSDGTNTSETLLACHCWGNSEGCPGNDLNLGIRTDTGADGQTWTLHTVDIPTELDRSNLTITIRHQQDSWDWTTAGSTVYFDAVTLQ